METVCCFPYVIAKIGYYKKRQVNKLLEIELELDIREDKEYKIEELKNSYIYAEEIIRG